MLNIVCVCVCGWVGGGEGGSVQYDKDVCKHKDGKEVLGSEFPYLNAIVSFEELQIRYTA